MKVVDDVWNSFPEKFEPKLKLILCNKQTICKKTKLINVSRWRIIRTNNGYVVQEIFLALQLRV